MTKLDLGAGAASPEGFTPLGNAHGSSIFPLPHGDGTVDEIRASHVLEHFPHRQVPEVLKDWVRALKPGGRLRIAVPDFGKIAEGYVAGNKLPVEAYVMGGQTDAADFHKALFDQRELKRLLSAAGLVLIRPWQSELADCASLPVSLNLEGSKPHTTRYRCSGVMSVPRLGFMDNHFCAVEALPKLRVTLRRSMGAYWGQCITAAIEEALAEENPDFVLTLDYDTVFRAEDVATLIQLMLLHPEADAIAPVQAARGVETSLFSVQNKDGRRVETIPKEKFAGDLMPASTAHFGLTLLRAERIKAMPKPWFFPTPSPDGTWHEGHVDDDIQFWRGWEKAGFTLFLAPRVVVGHMELMVRWPGKDLLAIHQPVKEWRVSGAPEGAWK